jgi:ABC-2 type transport system ATP-binding protein
MIQVNDLHLGYGKKKVFNGLNLQLHSGHIYGLLGKNGSGKSTLLRSLYGLLYPQQGSIQVLNYKPGDRLPSFLQKVFMVPEEFYLPDVPIDELIKYHAAFYPKFNLATFRQCLKDFDIPYEQSLQQMSYGQKKKVLISLGLSTNVELLLMDEPTNGLDIISKSQFRKTMGNIMNRETCVIISTHQLKDLEDLISRILIIDSARILFDQTIAAIAGRLTFAIVQDAAVVNNVLYEEASISGTAIVKENTGGEASRIDMELLYKTVMHNYEGLRKIFEA